MCLVPHPRLLVCAVILLSFQRGGLAGPIGAGGTGADQPVHVPAATPTTHPTASRPTPYVADLGAIAPLEVQAAVRDAISALGPPIPVAVVAPEPARPATRPASTEPTSRPVAQPVTATPAAATVAPGH